MNIKKEIEADSVLRFRPLVEAIADSFLKKLPFGQIERQEVIQWGMVGLLDALRKWKPEKENEFATYAEHRIRGSILDGLRDLDWVPRSIRDNSKKLEATKEKLEKRLGKSPDRDEIASALGKSLREYFDLLNQVQGTTRIPFEKVEPMLEDDSADSPWLELNKKRAKVVLSEAIEGLPTRQRLVLALYYFEDLSLKQIGRILRVTESRVSQLHKAGVEKLREKLKGKL